MNIDSPEEIAKKLVDSISMHMPSSSAYGFKLKLEQALTAEREKQKVCKRCKALDGVFVETVISAVIKRIKYCQNSKFKGHENAIALKHLETALLWLNKRTNLTKEK